MKKKTDCLENIYEDGILLGGEVCEKGTVIVVSILHAFYLLLTTMILPVSNGCLLFLICNLIQSLFTA